MNENNYSLNKSEMKTLCEIWEILNAIRARDGSPSGWDEGYFDTIINNLNKMILDKTNSSPHHHPFLFS